VLCVVQVQWWVTFNDPWSVAYLGYGIGTFPPGIRSDSKVYTAGHVIIKAHARAYHLYHDELGGNGEHSACCLNVYLTVCVLYPPPLSRYLSLL
jgi:beta-glucosidase/6-phospho-beta-glucosidase/beta-galactosidase